MFFCGAHGVLDAGDTELFVNRETPKSNMEPEN